MSQNPSLSDWLPVLLMLMPALAAGIVGCVGDSPCSARPGRVNTRQDTALRRWDTAPGGSVATTRSTGFVRRGAAPVASTAVPLHRTAGVTAVDVS